MLITPQAGVCADNCDVSYTTSLLMILLAVSAVGTCILDSQASRSAGRTCCPVTPADCYKAACEVNKIAYMYPLSAGTNVQAGSMQCDLLHHGTSINCTGVVFVRVIVNSFLCHIVGLAHLRCL